MVCLVFVNLFFWLNLFLLDRFGRSVANTTRVLVRILALLHVCASPYLSATACASLYLSATACASLYLSATACAILPTLEFHVFNSSALTRACAGSDNVRQYRRLKAISLRCLFNDLCCASILPACCLVNYRNGFTLLGVGRRRGN